RFLAAVLLAVSKQHCVFLPWNVMFDCLSQVITGFQAGSCAQPREKPQIATTTGFQVTYEF
ncbi:MAG: hypothetical protein VB912_02410, partial [Pirellulaceae bacterium]